MKAIEAVTRTWVEDAHGHPRYVLRSVAPLVKGFAPDGRPNTAFGAHPHWLDARMYAYNGRPLHDEIQARLSTHRIAFNPGATILRLEDNETSVMACARCGNTNQGFLLEWAQDETLARSSWGQVEHRTVLLECWPCGNVDRGWDAAATLAGWLIDQGQTERGHKLALMARIREWVRANPWDEEAC